MARNGLALLFVGSLLTGCLTNRYDINVSEAPQLEKGAILTREGQEQTLPSSYDVLPIPYEGEVLRHDPAQQDLIVAYPKSQSRLPPANNQPRVQALGGPVRVRLDGSLTIVEGRGRPLRVPEGSVDFLRVSVPSPGKTTALVLGLTVPPVALVTAIIVAFASGAGSMGPTH